jgi:hypothetical protein
MVGRWQEAGLTRNPAIELAALGEDLVKQRGAQVLVTVNLGACRNKHVLGKTHAGQAAMRALHPPDCLFAALADYHHQTHVAVIGRSSPGVRTKQIDFLRLKLGLEPLNSLFQKPFWNGLHGFQATMGEDEWKAVVFDRALCRVACGVLLSSPRITGGKK